MRKYLFIHVKNFKPQEVSLLELADCGLWTDEEFERLADIPVGEVVEFPDLYQVKRVC